MRVRGGGLNGSYKTAEFHFHWGSTDDQGSEHSLEGHKFPLEMHVVNFAEKYGTIKQAMAQPDGLAVLGVFFQLSDQDNPDFESLDHALKHVHKAGEHNLVEHFMLRSLLPTDLSRYWRYNGSLTTPYCFETVTWTIFTEPQKISRSQLETLRGLLHEEGHDINDRGEHHTNTPSRLVDNWRPIQPLNGRVVKRSFVDASAGGVYVTRGPSTPVPNLQVTTPPTDTQTTAYDTASFTTSLNPGANAIDQVNTDTPVPQSSPDSNPNAVDSLQYSPGHKAIENTNTVHGQQVSQQNLDNKQTSLEGSGNGQGSKTVTPASMSPVTAPVYHQPTQESVNGVTTNDNSVQSRSNVNQINPGIHPNSLSDIKQYVSNNVILTSGAGTVHSQGIDQQGVGSDKTVLDAQVGIKSLSSASTLEEQSLFLSPNSSNSTGGISTFQKLMASLQPSSQASTGAPAEQPITMTTTVRPFDKTSKSFRGDSTQHHDSQPRNTATLDVRSSFSPETTHVPHPTNTVSQQQQQQQQHQHQQQQEQLYNNNQYHGHQEILPGNPAVGQRSPENHRLPLGYLLQQEPQQNDLNNINSFNTIGNNKRYTGFSPQVGNQQIDTPLQNYPSQNNGPYTTWSPNAGRQNRLQPGNQQPSSEYLRGILEKLAATNRINTRMADLNSVAPRSVNRGRLENSVNQMSRADFTNPIHDRDGNILIMNRATGDMYVLRAGSNDVTGPPGRGPQQQLDGANRRQQVQRGPSPSVYRSNNVIYGAGNKNGEQLGEPSWRRSNGGPSEVFLQRLERPVRISSPFYDRLYNWRQQQYQTPVSTVPSLRLQQGLPLDQPRWYGG